MLREKKNIDCFEAVGADFSNCDFERPTASYISKDEQIIVAFKWFYNNGLAL